MRKLQYKKFTLVELLAAMAVFSILLLVSMRLFSGAQQLWVRSEQKTNAFADARTAMEFVAVRMQTLVYYENVPFSMKDNEIWFATSMPMDNRDDEYYLRFLKFERDANAGTLVMRIYAGKEESRKFIAHFPPFKNQDAAITAWDAVSSKLGSSETVELIDNVTDFKIHGFFAVKNGNNWELKPQESVSSAFKDGSSFITPPYMIEVEISLLDNKEAYLRWKDGDDDKKKEIFSEYGYTFRRAILLGHRSGE
ncbi:MAG: prepilin-type N-terminal cleavage/methylation domain-containing protein [Lentisphaerae bacterium]|nr:prepilin-type N-terminal cleavage/methylation domain-containing protein [Lentisphaerota bacterium]